MAAPNWQALETQPPSITGAGAITSR